MKNEAAELIRAQGGRARQHVLDRLVAAMRAGDEAEARRLHLLLETVTRLLDHFAPPPG